MEVRGSYDQRAFEIDGPKASMLFDAQFDWLGDAVEAQVVLFQIDFGEELTFELFELHFVERAFEHRFLHTLADAFACLGDTSQALAAGGGFCRDVICDDDEHGLFRQKREITFHLASQGAGEKARLGEGR